MMKTFLYQKVFASGLMSPNEGVLYCFLASAALSEPGALKKAQDGEVKLPCNVDRSAMVAATGMSPATLWRSMKALESEGLYYDGVVDVSYAVGSRYFPMYDISFDRMSAICFVLHCYLLYRRKTDKVSGENYADVSIARIVYDTGLSVNSIPGALMRLKRDGYTERKGNRIIILK